MTAPLPVLILKTGCYPIHHGGLGIIRSLGRLGIPVYTVAEDHLIPAASSRYLTGSFVWHASDLPRQEMLDALASIARKLEKPTILIPTDDLGAILMAEESAALREWFIFPDILPGAPRKLANKQMLYALCRQAGVPCPDTRCPASLSDINRSLGWRVEQPTDLTHDSRKSPFSLLDTQFAAGEPRSESQIG
jgi:D-aspartate ligase